MKLKSLIDVMDPRLQVILIGIRCTTGIKKGYNFDKLKWSEDYLYTPDKLVLAGGLNRFSIVRTYANNRVMNMSVMPFSKIKALKGIEAHDDKLVVITVDLEFKEERPRAKTRKSSNNAKVPPIQAVHSDNSSKPH
jgi:hypothetical protein